MASTKIYKVFVSSTFQDMREERAEVQKALLKLNCLPVGMELFPAADDETWEFIKSQISDSDYYVVAIAGRYGSVDEKGLSFTEKEYDYARERNIPSIGFLRADPESIPANQVESDPIMIARLEAFKAKIRKRPIRMFSTPHQLATEVVASFVDLIHRKPATGYIRADEAIDFKKYSELLEENARLSAAEGNRQSSEQEIGELMPWSDYWAHLLQIARRLRNASTDGFYTPDIIIGITNGGAMFCDLLVREAGYRCPSVTLWANRRVDRTVLNIFDNPPNHNLCLGVKKLFKHESIEILLVDDVIASGTTLNHAMNFLKKEFTSARIYFLPLVFRDNDKYEEMKDQILWTSDPAKFGINQEGISDLHVVRYHRFPYLKYLRST